MGGYETFYGNSNYGINSKYGNPISNYTPAGNVALALDVRTANQLREVSNKINTGTGSMEVQLTFPQVAESIPNSHLEEINRLRKLTGVDLTLHGPLVDPTGFTGEGNWDIQKQKQAERQIWNAVSRATKINPEDNVVVTLHSSNGMPEPETRVWNPKLNDGKGGEEITSIAVVNERSGKIAQLPPPTQDYMLYGDSEKRRESAKQELDKLNRDQWLQSLSQITHELGRAKELFSYVSEGKMELGKKPSEESFEHYDLFKNKKEEYKKIMDESKKEFPVIEDVMNNKMEMIGRGDIYVRDAFNQFKEIYNQAYQAIEKDNKNGAKNNEIKNLKQIGENLRKSIDTKEGYIKDYKELGKFADTLIESVQQISSLKEPPKVYKELKEFAIEKSAETFSNVALNAYKQFGDKAPILSIENPPVGMGLSRAEELSRLIKESREMFEEKLKKEGLSKSQAKEQAEKLIGATWDVGHINMLRKFGYDDKQLKEEAKRIAPYVKNIHLSDNFGYEHTELPMGMGNVPMKAHLEELKKAQMEKFNKIKQVIETGNWYQHFQTSPFAETLSAYGSPVYGTGSPQWNQVANGFSGYFAGYGMNPDIHHSLYGAGFANLPTELGGQMAGGKSRLSGAPIE